jgi:RNA polymerase sigma factor (sigma-70 family)
MRVAAPIVLLMLDSFDDADLLRATRSDPAAFGVFYERHERAVLVFMLRRTQTPELAADLTAEVFAAALAGVSRFRPMGAPPAAWLFGIARNVLAASYRSARVQDDMRRKLGMPALAVSDDDADSLDELAAITAGRDALDLLEHLPDDQRDAIRARVLEDRDYREIATELECSASVVRKRVSRGLAVLRNQLDSGADNA